MPDVTIDRETFYQFESIRQSGVINTMDRSVASQLGITKEEHIHIIKNYGQLLEKYGESND